MGDLDIWTVSEINSTPVALLGRVQLDYPAPETDDPFKKRSLYYVPIMHQSYDGGAVVGLLLHSVQEQLNQYKRVGWLQIDIDEISEDTLFTLMKHQKNVIDLR